MHKAIADVVSQQDMLRHQDVEEAIKILAQMLQNSLKNWRNRSGAQKNVRRGIAFSF